MAKNIGEKIYWYVVRNGELNIHEGTVVPSKYDIPRNRIRFTSSSAIKYYPKDSEIGVVIAGGPTLWLEDRDDELAKRLIVEYEEIKIAELENQIKIRTELVKSLKD